MKLGKRVLSLTLALAVALMLVPVLPAAAADSGLAIGSTRNFSLPNTLFLNKFSAVLAAESEHALVYVQKDELNTNTLEPLANQTHLSSFANYLPAGTAENPQAKAVAGEFEKIYAMFSTPGADAYYGQPHDVDGNGKVILFVCDIGNDGKESGGTVGGYISGIFQTGDFYMNVSPTGSNLNKGDILYLDAAPNQGYAKMKNDPAGFYQTIAHEYAHLLSYSCVFSQLGTSAKTKDVFVEEAFAELAGYLYSGKFSPNRLSYFFTNQFRPYYSFIDWNTGNDSLYAHFGAAALMGLAYYNHGGNIHDLLMDTRSGNDDSFIAWGDHYMKSSETTSFGNFDKFFDQFALDTFVSDPLKQGPYIDNVSFDSWDQIDLYNQPVLKPGEDFVQFKQAPFAAPYFVLARKGTRLSAGENAIQITLTDAGAKSSFYAVYPKGAFSSDFGKTSGRTYTKLIPGQQMTIPVGQGNEFAIVGVNYNNTSSAVINYTPTKDESLPFDDVQGEIPAVQNLKVEHGANGAALTWDALTNLPEGMALNYYEIYRGDTRLGSVQGGSASPKYTDAYSNLEEGKSYEYTVKTAIKIAGYSQPLSNEGVKADFTLSPLTVGVPTGIKIEPENSYSPRVSLSWTKASALYSTDVRQAAASSTEVYRDGKLVLTSTSSSYSDTDSALEAGKTYTYKLRSYATSGGNKVYSAFSAPIKVKVPYRTYTLTVLSQTGGSASASPTTGSFEQGAKIKVTAAAKSGYVFDGWVSYGGGTFGNAASKTTVFTMPAQNVTVQAKFKRAGSGDTPSKSQFTYRLSDKTYSGKRQKVSVRPKSGVGKVTAVYYNGSKTAPSAAGTYKVKVDVAKGTQYAAAKKVSLGTFTIKKANLSRAKISVANKAWTGRQLRPKVQLSLNGRNLNAATNTTAVYGKNKNIGKGTIRLTGKGNFTGTKTISFKIVPQKTRVSKINASKNKMNVSWKKVTSAQKITKYEVRYRVRGASKWKTKIVKASAASTTIKGLRPGRVYQVQVRSYKVVSGKKYYSAWSGAKTGGRIR